MSKAGQIVSRTDGAVRTITIDNAAKANCITASMFTEIRAAWRAADDDDSILVVVLEAVGDRHFCSGADVSLFRDPNMQAEPMKSFTMTSRLCGVTKPVVVAVSGQVVGGALGLVADC